VADADQKVLDRVGKLLRLAAPNSGGTDAERESAMMEAAKLIAENNLVVAPAPPKQRRPRPGPPPPPPPPYAPPSYAPPYYPPPPRYGYYPGSSSNWTEATAPTTGWCCACHRTIYRGETTWYDSAHGHRHYDITCTE
jgi:hypothetical protein